MADVKISNLPAAAADSTGSELVPAVQAGGTVKMTTNQIAKIGFQDIVTNTTANYDLTLADIGGWIRMDFATANTVTVPTNATVPFVIGTTLNGIQVGAGATTVVGAAGVTIIKPSDRLAKLRTQYSAFAIVKVNTNEWELVGDLGVL